MPEDRGYLAVNIPKKLKRYFDELLETPAIQKQLELARFRKTPSGLGCWIISNFLIDNTSYRFQHLNTNKNRITLKDQKTGRISDVYIITENEPYFELKCELCSESYCEHLKAVLNMPEVMKPLEKKGWKYKPEA